MAAWTLIIGPDLKANIATDLDSAALSEATFYDPPPNLSDATTLAHFAAAVSAAQSQLAALTGPATKAKVTLQGYRDANAAGQMFEAGSKITVNVIEVW